MVEYGVFNDEGCIERGFYDSQSAEQACEPYRADEEEVTVRALCREHDEQPADSCEECFAEEDDDDNEEEEI